MGRKLVAVHDGAMFMFVDSTVQEVTDETKCRVYNKFKKVMAPELSIGCWTCRMGPWEEPTPKEREEAKKWQELKK